MTVKELRELLQTFPDDLPIAYALHSEYEALNADQIIVEPLYDNGGYLSRPYRHRDKALLKDYVTFPGN